LKGKVAFTNDKVRVDADVMKDLFTDACAEICQKAKEFFSSIRKHRIDKILMVGGFSESEMLQVMVRKAFPGIKLIIPGEAGLAILKGAVLFGHTPKMITERACNNTYGIRAFKHFEPGLDPLEKMEAQGDFVFCKDYFSKHANIGKVYMTEEKVYTQEYNPSEVSGSKLEVE
jgi:molecular chaperone DnaK (HSP70)